MKKKTWFSAIPMLIVLLPVCSAQAAIDSGYGAVADVGTYDSCAVLCLRPGGLNDQVLNGGEFASSASATIDNGTAFGFASALFQGDVFSPLLQSRAESPLGDVTAGDGIATAIQGYTYMGAAAQDFSIQVSLSGAIDEPNASSEGSIEGRAAVYSHPDAPFGTNYSSFILEEIALGGELLANEQLFLTTSLDLSTATLDFTLNPGDEVYVWMQLETKSERGAIVDALNTFSMTFTAGDTATLQARVVPEPASVWLFSTGLIALGLAGRSSRLPTTRNWIGKRQRRAQGSVTPPCSRGCMQRSQISN
jgi:hypothetical protein